MLIIKMTAFLNRNFTIGFLNVKYILVNCFVVNLWITQASALPPSPSYCLSLSPNPTWFSLYSVCWSGGQFWSKWACDFLNLAFTLYCYSLCVLTPLIAMWFPPKLHKHINLTPTLVIYYLVPSGWHELVICRLDSKLLKSAVHKIPEDLYQEVCELFVLKTNPTQNQTPNKKL